MLDSRLHPVGEKSGRCTSLPRARSAC